VDNAAFLFFQNPVHRPFAMVRMVQGQLGFGLARSGGGGETPPAKVAEDEKMSCSWMASHANCSLARND
jgi:hypothetical protein